MNLLFSVKEILCLEELNKSSEAPPDYYSCYS